MKSSLHPRAFSMIEVMLALGLCCFALVALLGLFTVGLKDNHESQQEIAAANLASLLISLRTSAPTSSANTFSNLAIPAGAMTRAYANAYGGGASGYVGPDGRLTSAAKAAYLVRCSAGTNAATGPNTAQVYLMLSWPPQADPSSPAARHYEIVTAIPLR